MTPEATLHAYESALRTQDWDQVAPFIADDACFVFTEDTFHGKGAIGDAIRRTFALIEGDDYSIANVHWVHRGSDSALCTYDYRWAGRIDGERHQGSGRGTTLLVRDGETWRIQHEHLGPPPRVR